MNPRTARRCGANAAWNCVQCSWAVWHLPSAADRCVKASRHADNTSGCVSRSLWAGVGNKMVTSMLHAAVMFSVVEIFRALNRVVARKLLKLE